MELIISFIALIISFIALKISWSQLSPQRKELDYNNRLNSLIHLAEMVKDKWAYHDKIIQEKKEKHEKWKGHADRINHEFRPMLKKINHYLAKHLEMHKGFGLDCILRSMCYTVIVFLPSRIALIDTTYGVVRYDNGVAHKAELRLW